MSENETFTWEGNYICPNCHERRQGDDVEMTMHIVLCPPLPFPQYSIPLLIPAENEPLSEPPPRAILTRMKWFINFFCWRKKVMAILEDIVEVVDTISVKLDGISTEVAALQAQVAAGSPATVEQLQGVLDSLKGVVTKEDAINPPPAE